MPKKKKSQKKSKLPSQENSPRPRAEFFRKYPSDSHLVDTVGDAISAFNCDPLDLSPSLTDSPCGSIGPSDRFFIPVADVASGSLIEEARLTSSGSRERSAKIYGSPVVVNSSDPIEDFRRSMEEMLGASHVEREEALDWKQLEELLDAYLEVNERRVYRYIFAAFFDLTVQLLLSGHRP
ncbi:transcription repressor OFP14-like protein [Carex littledalei]|uniref:Transcription repressor n=1 Tax=Carex littledalei TaxID=544730 RepID=A0A833QJC7_9POAL|nr:transcription repressor OFP14-like protein [Carex littledalei]